MSILSLALGFGLPSLRCEGKIVCGIAPFVVGKEGDGSEINDEGRGPLKRT